MQILLETSRLILRRFTDSDVEFLFDLDNDPAVMRFINGGIFTPRDVIQNDILPTFLHYDERFPEFGFWAAIHQATGEFLGWFSFRPVPEAPDAVTLGFRLRQVAWGYGYATEGSRALIRKGFNELGVQRVYATTYEENLASRHVLEKLGMTLVRSFRMTAADLLLMDTFYAAMLELWDGNDLEYMLEKSGYLDATRYLP